MAFDQRLYANNAKTTLTAALGSGDTSVTVADGGLFPTITTPGQYFLVTVDSGASVEIIRVLGRNGNVFNPVLRAQEGTLAQDFLVGTRVENRATKETYESFARYEDRLGDLASVDLLPKPSETVANSLLCQSPDDGGTPIVAVRNGNTSWRFPSHPFVTLNTTASSAGTATRVPLQFASSTVPITTTGSHIVQFTSGANAGLSRIVTSTDSEYLYWAEPLPSPVAAGDAFVVYRSIIATFSTLSYIEDDVLVYALIFRG